VFLLTDGHATTIKSPPEIIARAKNVLGNGTCSVFGFGFGTDHDSKLLKSIASNFSGLYYFIQSENDISVAFSDCLAGLISCVSQKMILSIERLVFYLQLPGLSVPEPDFKIAKVILNYYNVMNCRYEKIVTVCEVKRSPEIPKEQMRDYQMDLQINRLTTATAMEQAQSKTDLNQAREIISNAIEQLKGSVSASDLFTVSLIADLQEILNDMKDRETFQRVAVAKMAWKGDAHEQQRTIGSAGIQYINSQKKEMQMEAYMREEAAAEEAARAMKERIGQRKKELVSQKQNQREEEEQMRKYCEEERASEEASQAMKQRIEARKKELQSQSTKEEEVQKMKKYEKK